MFRTVSTSPTLALAAAGLLIFACSRESIASEVSDPAPIGGWFVEFGIGAINFATEASVKIAGRSVPSAKAHASNSIAPGFGIGYYFNPNISVVALVGVPPETTVTGQGSLSGLTLGKITYGPSLVALNYHFRDLGAFQPFIGGGINYTVIFDTKDASILHLAVENSIGPVLRAGFNLAVSDRTTLVFSANKLFVTTHATGEVAPAIPHLGGAPAMATVVLDPLILDLGVSYHF